MNVGIVAGEASGDLLGAGLVSLLRKAHPELTAIGVGGPAMIAAGFQSLHDMERLSVMGLVEPLLRLPELFRMRRDLVNYFLAHRPDVFIGIDSPDFNLGLELKLHQEKIPVIHYVSPSVWAWRQKRIVKIAKATDLVLTLFPFEADFYQRHQVPVRFVGHPLADLIPVEPSKNEARKKLKLEEDAIYIAILPGSRGNELKYLADVFIKTAEMCWKQRPQIKFITSAVNQKRFDEFNQRYQEISPNLPITLFQGASHDVMAAADVVLVASGTATLETMLFKRPMVIAYRMASMTYQVGRHLVKIPFIGLPNLLANERLVPEFIQDDATPAHLSAALLDFIDHPEKAAELKEKFTALHHQLKRNASQQAAEAVLEFIHKRK